MLVQYYYVFPLVMAEPDDPRLKFFEDRVSTAFGARTGKHAAAFRKLVTSEDSGRHLLDFVNVPEVGCVFVGEGPKELVCFRSLPASHKKKVAYFLKLQKVVLTLENVSEVLCLHASVPALPMLFAPKP